MKNAHFKHTESYMHLHAKRVVADWIVSYPERFGIERNRTVEIIEEVEFKVDGKIIFVPDLSVYTFGKLTHMFEIVKTSDLSGWKLHQMQYYLFMNKLNPRIYSIDAKYVMDQIKCPYKIKAFNYTLFNDGELF